MPRSRQKKYVPGQLLETMQTPCQGLRSILAICYCQVVNTWSERQLGHIFKEYGEEKFWRLYANR